MIFFEAIIPGRIEIKQPPVIVKRACSDSKTSRMRLMAKPSNYASKDRGYQLKVNPIARTRRGNAR